MNKMPETKRESRKSLPIGRAALAGVVLLGLAGTAFADHGHRSYRHRIPHGHVKHTEIWYYPATPRYVPPRRETNIVHYHYHYGAPQTVVQPPTEYAYPAPSEYPSTSYPPVSAPTRGTYAGPPVSNLTLGNVIGAAVGGYLGSHVGGGRGRLAATAGGAVAGYVIGGELGDRRWRY